MSNTHNEKQDANSSATPSNLLPSNQQTEEQNSATLPSGSKSGLNVNQRPQRKAKNRDAIQKHLNRDVDLGMEEEPKKKSSTKKAQIALQQRDSLGPQPQQNISGSGKRSSSRTNGGKSSQPKQEINVPNSIVKSSEGKSSLAPGAQIQFVSSMVQSFPRDSSQDSKKSEFVTPVETQKISNSNKSKKNGPQGKQSITTDKSANSGKSSLKKPSKQAPKQEAPESSGTTKQTKISAKSSVTAKKEVDKQPVQSFNVPQQESKKKTPKVKEEIQPPPPEEEENESDDDMDEEGEDSQDEDEDADQDDMDDIDDEEEESDSDASHSKKQLRLDSIRKQKKMMTKEMLAANRALRIKMGKSGAQAASRRSIKKGKDACQRKLWNQGEDNAIVRLVAQYGTKRWTFIAQQLTDVHKIGGRTGKQCRERWHNHLDPNIKKTPINDDEEKIIFDAHKIYGNKWADIAKLLNGRSDNCIKNYYYSTLRKHIRRINKSLKQCQVAKRLNLKVKTLTADILFPLVKDNKIQYNQVKIIDPKKFEDLEHTMRMIFNHEDGQQVTQRGIIAAAQKRLNVEKQLEEMRQREQQEQDLHGEGLSEDNLDDDEMDNEDENDEINQKSASKSRNKTKLLSKRKQQQSSSSNLKLKRQKIKDDSDTEQDDDEDSHESKSLSSQEQDEDMSDQEDKDDAENSQRTSTVNRASESKDQYSLKKRNQKPQLKSKMNEMIQASQMNQGMALNPFAKGSGSFNQVSSISKQIQVPKTLQMKPPISKNGLKIAPGNNCQKSSSLADHLKIGVQSQNQGGQTSNSSKQGVNLGGLGSYLPGQTSSHNIFKSNLMDPLLSYKKVKKEVTINNNDDYVTKDNFGNRSNCSDNEQLHQEHKKDKKHKKKKKKKSHKSDGTRNRSKHHVHPSSLMGGIGLNDPNVDELEAQFNYMDSNARFLPQSMNMMDILRFTNQKDSSASKIYPSLNFHDSFMHSKGRMKESQHLGYPHGPHTCFPNTSQGHSQSGAAGQNSNYMPPHYHPSYMYQYPQYMNYLNGYPPAGPNGMMYHPSQGMFPVPTPIGKKGPQLSSTSKSLSFGPQDSQNLKLFKGQISQTSISGHFNQAIQKNSKAMKIPSKDKPTDSNQRESEEKGEGNNEKKKKDDGEKDKTSKEESHQFMQNMSHEAMNQYFGGGHIHPMHLQAYYQKNGHMAPPPFGMPPHLGMHPFYQMAPGMHMPHGGPQQWQRDRQQQAHEAPPLQHRGHSQSYQNQFVMPVTPMGLKSVFGPEKLINQLNGAASDNGGAILTRNRGNSNQTQPNMLNLLTKNREKGEDIGSQSQQDGREKKTSQKDSHKPLALQLHRRASSTDNLRSSRNQQQPTQFNNNITLMINHFGNAPNEQKSVEGELGSKGAANALTKQGESDKEKEKSDKEVKLLQGLSDTKQNSTQKFNGATKKLSGMINDQNDSGMTFNQQVKNHKKISQLKDMLINKFINSRSATPSNQNYQNQGTGIPPLSTSNYLMFAHQGNQKMHMPQHLNQLIGQKGTHNVFMDSQPLQSSRLIQATPKLLHGVKRIPNNNTPKGSQTYAQGENGQNVLTASKQNNLHSGHTFNAGVASIGGSRLGTKTHAQLTAAKKGRGSTLITPKVSTIEQDPDAHRKMLEKMFQNTDASIMEKIDIQANFISAGGAFTAKKQSGENSNSKNTKKDEEKDELKQPGPKIQSLGENHHGERDSLGFFYANPHSLTMNMEPMASIYTGAPEGNQSSKHATPLLGKRISSQLEQVVDLQTKRSAQKPIKVEDVDRVDTLLNDSDNEEDGQKDKKDVEMKEDKIE